MDETFGIGGFQMFDANVGDYRSGQFSTPQYVDRRVVFHSPLWQEMLRHAAQEAERLGLEMTMHAAGGWSETGGPWVRPEQAMKKLVWSETRVTGGQAFKGVLPPPPSVNGPFQAIAQPGMPFELPEAAQAQAETPPDPTYYRDAAVAAFRLPQPESRASELHPRITASAAALETSKLFDGNLVETAVLPAPEDGSPAWIQFEFAQPFSARGLTFVGGSRGVPEGELQFSHDGVAFRTVLELPGPTHGAGGSLTGFPVRTYAFPETRARYFRLLLRRPARTMIDDIIESFGLRVPRHYEIAELDLLAAPRVHRWEDKAAFGILFEYDSVSTPEISQELCISPDDVVDLTDRMQPDGSLEWDVPPGEWVILRLGYSLTGAKNRPAPPEATGFEVDKLNPRHAQAYLEGFTDPVRQALGPLFGRSLRYILMDSWEAGLQNWTDEMPAEFRRRRGYDPLPYLPVLTGRIVGSAEISDRFLWDFRRTLAEMLADYHYAVPAEYFAKWGIQIYAEAAGANNPVHQDALMNKARVAVPMGEFWTLLPGRTTSPYILRTSGRPPRPPTSTASR